MNKTIRIVLYVLSILTVIGVIAAFILSGGKAPSQNGTQSASAEHNGEAGKTEEIKDGQAEAGRETSGGAPASEADESDGAAGKEQDGSEKNGGETETVQESVQEERTNGAADAAETKPGADKDTTLLFTGDVLFANAFKAGYDAKGIQGVVSEELLLELKDADILMINNEFPFSDRGTAAADKQFTFRCSPSYAKALTEMGVDIVSLANNHTLDYGKDALTDTFIALDGEGILYAGAGNSVERAEQLQIIEANGKKFGFLAVSRVIPEAGWKAENSLPGLFSCYDETRLIELVEEAKKECDFLAVYPHWGVEYQAHPEEYQKKIAKKCIQAGADVIIGSHTHCLQGIEYIEGKPVFYSLGNFIFGQNIEKSAVVKIILDDNGGVSYQLVPVSASGGLTQIPQGDAGSEILSYIEGISVNAKVDEMGNVTE